MLTGRPNVSSSGRWQHVNERAGLPARSRSAVGVAKHTHKHTNTQTHRHTDRHTDRHTHRHTHTHFVRACAIEMQGNISHEPRYTEIYRKNAAAQNRGPHFVRACAVEMHVNISQEPLFTEIYRKNAQAQSEHPDQAPAFTTVKTPQCGHTVWGIRSPIKTPIKT